MRHATRQIGLAVAVLASWVIPSPARAGVTLTFEDVPLGSAGPGQANVFGSYNDPASDFRLLGDFSARGPGAPSSITPETAHGSGQVTTSLAAFGGTTVDLVREGGLTFSLLSIDLARENQFNNPSNNGILYPSVTFTGTKQGGTTVSQTFTVDQSGFDFETFAFSGFTDLVAVTWSQPPFGSTPGSPGLHQFDNIVLDVPGVAAVPEPSTLISGGLAGLFGLGALYRRRRAVKATA